ncbi:MAG: histidine phosphatase family protein [Clostridia bacterium]
MIALIRHGMTMGNKLRRYIGATDESLCDTECLKRTYPDVELVVSSPMKRCVETAEFIYPDKNRIIIDDLRECDFGIFENKSYEDLKNNAAYKKWLETMCKMPFPGGESHDEFKKRCIKSFNEIISKNPKTDIAFVIHGGTIMAIMESIFDDGFFDYQVRNGSGYVIDMAERKIISQL